MSRLLQQVRDQVFDKTSRNRVESVSKACRKPARTCRKPGCKIKCGAADLPRRPIAEKFLHGSIEPANACQLTKFQLSSSISLLALLEGSQNLMWGLLVPWRTPYAETFMCAQCT